MVESGVTRDVARTYREALQREGKDLPAYNVALRARASNRADMSFVSTISLMSSLAARICFRVWFAKGR